MTSLLSFCPACGTPHEWSWVEAFDKFGFNDGDGLVNTCQVAEVLRKAGYDVVVRPWGCHNVVITEINLGGFSLIPPTATVGYDDPRSYLPSDIIALLDRAWPRREVQP